MHSSMTDITIKLAYWTMAATSSELFIHPPMPRCGAMLSSILSGPLLLACTTVTVAHDNICYAIPLTIFSNQLVPLEAVRIVCIEKGTHNYDMKADITNIKRHLINTTQPSS